MSPTNPTPTTPNPTPGEGFAVTAGWEKPVAARGGTAAFAVRIAAPKRRDGQRRTPTDVAFVLDRSGSMSGEKIVLVKQAVDEACKHLTDDDGAALVVFDNEIDVLQKLDRATPRVKAGIRMALVGVDARGGTNLSGGWFAGCAEIDPAGKGPGEAMRTRRAILLTDGQANDGICDPRELGRHANRIRQLGVSTTTVGVGHGFDEFLLSAMAESGGGNFQYVENPSELRPFFERELQELLDAVALGMTVTVTCPEGMHATPLAAFPHHREQRTWIAELGEIPAEEVIELVYEIRVKDGFAGAEGQFAVEVAWSDPSSDSRRTERVGLPALRIGTEDEVAAAPVDRPAEEAAALQRAARDKKAALEAARRGDYEGAAHHARGARVMYSLRLESPRYDEDLADLIAMETAFDAGQDLSASASKDMVQRAERIRRSRRSVDGGRARDLGQGDPRGATGS